MSRPRAFAVVLSSLDALAALGVFHLVFFLRGAALGPDNVSLALLVPTLVLVLSLYLIDGYSTRTDFLSADYTSQHAIALAAAAAATLLLTFVVVPENYGLRSSRLAFLLSFVALVPVTLSYRRFLYLRRLARRGTRHLVFIGDAASREEFRAECARMRAYYPLTFAVNAATDREGALPTGVRRFAEVLEEIETGRLPAEAIVIREGSHDLPPGVSQRLVDLTFAGVPTYTLEVFHHLYWHKIPLYRLNDTWLFQEGFQIAREPVFERVKRASDLVLSLLGLALAAPLMLAAAAAIWAEDRHPPLFRQTRIGKNNVPFRLYKLRTMRAGAGGARYTATGDERITRVGRFLRSSRLDELPQLWNVLRGDMSLIGPRAEWDQLVADYERAIPCYHFRHLMKPGITGWAQVNYPYGAGVEDTVRKLEYDLYYVRHFSFVLDAAIVLKTLNIMLRGRGR